MSKRGESIWKRKDGRWEGRFIKYRTPEGKAIYGSVYAKSYSEVKAKREKAIEDYKKSTEAIFPYNSISSVTREFLNEHRFTIKDSTYARYVEIADTHLIPDVGELNIAEFSQDQANSYIVHLQSEGKCGGGALAPKTVKDIISVLKLVFKYAEKRRYLPASSLSFTIPKQAKSTIQILNETQQTKLESYVCSIADPYKFGVYLCLYTGLRIGELCALRWSDVDSENSTLSVNRTVLRVKNTMPNADKKTRLLINSPKTPSSERVIPLAGQLNSYLKSLREQESAIGNVYVLTGSSNFIEPRNYYERYKRYLESCGLNGFNFHALRHTFATRCIEAGVDPKVLSEILGHASVRITLDRYVHPSLETKRASMERLFVI